MRKRYFIIGVLVVIFAAAGMWYTAFSPIPPAPQTPSASVSSSETGVVVGKLAPGFTLTDVNGKTVTVGNTGKVTIINFWATWCPPCREEMPELNRFSQQQQKVAFYAINIQESKDKVLDFLHKNQFNNIPVLFDSDGATAKLFRINAIPTTLVIDDKGIIKYRKAGAVTMSELESVLKSISGGK